MALLPPRPGHGPSVRRLLHEGRPRAGARRAARQHAPVAAAADAELAQPPRVELDPALRRPLRLPVHVRERSAAASCTWRSSLRSSARAPTRASTQPAAPPPPAARRPDRVLSCQGFSTMHHVREALERAKARLDRLDFYPAPVELDGVRIWSRPWFFRLPKLKRYDGYAFVRTILLRHPPGRGALATTSSPTSCATSGSSSTSAGTCCGRGRRSATRRTRTSSKRAGQSSSPARSANSATFGTAWPRTPCEAGLASGATPTSSRAAPPAPAHEPRRPARASPAPRSAPDRCSPGELRAASPAVSSELAGTTGAACPLCWRVRATPASSRRRVPFESLRRSGCGLRRSLKCDVDVRRGRRNRSVADRDQAARS